MTTTDLQVWVLIAAISVVAAAVGHIRERGLDGPHRLFAIAAGWWAMVVACLSEWQRYDLLHEGFRIPYGTLLGDVIVQTYSSEYYAVPREGQEPPSLGFWAFLIPLCFSYIVVFLILPRIYRWVRDGFTKSQEPSESREPAQALPKLPALAAAILTAILISQAITSPSASRFIDNGDGTISDTQTNLTWEKKSDDGSVHDQDNSYTWSTGTKNPDGTAFTEFLPALNAGGGFAEHTDWRLPTIDELSGLLDSLEDAPKIFSIFKAGATPGCSVTSASCSWADSAGYWSSSTYQGVSDNALFVGFNGGYAYFGSKTDDYYVRAVRSGS